VEEQQLSRPEAHSSAHEEHHHHHHHSRRHHRKKNKFQKFWKKHKKSIRNIAMLVLALALVLTVAAFADLYTKGYQKDPEVSDSLQQVAIRTELPHFEGDIPLIKEAALQYLNRDPGEDAMSAMKRINTTMERLDVGLPVRLSFDVSGLPTGCSVVSATLEVSEHQNLSNPTVYHVAPGQNAVNVPHLKTNTQYYYLFSCTLSDGTVTSAGSSFRTADTPRILSIDGIANVRDIGGWKTVDGKTIRQGLLYRGTELDGAVEEKYTLTDTGRHDMLAVLGIRTDMDLRARTDNAFGSDALGTGVRHIYYGDYGAPCYVDIFGRGYMKLMAQIFADLAVEGNYPVYLHCTYGMDRTGTVCYLLEALLGLSEPDLQAEYELSVLYSGYVGTEYLLPFVEEMKKLPGDTMQQKAEGYLLSAGVTAEQIAEIRRIFLVG
jgi:protein-tyrosine phosphatase